MQNQCFLSLVCIRDNVVQGLLTTVGFRSGIKATFSEFCISSILYPSFLCYPCPLSSTKPDITQLFHVIMEFSTAGILKLSVALAIVLFTTFVIKLYRVRNFIRGLQKQGLVSSHHFVIINPGYFNITSIC